MMTIIAYKTCDKCGRYEVRTETSASLSTLLDTVIGDPTKKWGVIHDGHKRQYMDVCPECYIHHTKENINDHNNCGMGV